MRTEFGQQLQKNPALIGGVRIRVGSEIFDGSIKAGLARLEARF